MKKVGFFLLVLLHTVLLVVLSLLWLNFSFTYDNESTIISAVSIAKTVLFKIEAKPSKNDFLLINVSYQKTLIPKLDHYGFEIGNEAITDRVSLAALFEKTSSFNNHRYLVCDIFLDQPSPADSVLLHHVRRTKNILFPYHRQDGKFLRPIIPIPQALSDYDSDFGSFLKYSYLQYDTCQTIALKMYLDLHRGIYKKSGWFYKKNGRLVLNSFILEFPIRQYDIFREDTVGYNSIHLTNFLSLPDPLMEEMLKNKIVVIGDFLETDLHQTIYGANAGPLIHLNAYLNLRENKNMLTPWFFIYIFSAFYVFSFFLFKKNKVSTLKWIRKIQSSKLGGFLFDYLKYALFLLLMSITSYLIFGIHLNILIISLYFSIAEYLIEYYYKNVKQIS
ncbi:MAG: hypothetical protein JNM78_19825 [Cyclobacteriaceae bacterium]|nr:hypothetical protein [Cyclobacteriaceae bacterium]